MDHEKAHIPALNNNKKRAASLLGAIAFLALAAISCQKPKAAPDLSDPLTGLDRLTNAGVRIARSGTVVYVDPIAVTAFSGDADLILITHGHTDHFSVTDINKLSRQDTIVVVPEKLSDRVTGLKGQKVPVTAGAAGTVKGVAYAAFASYNLKKTYHPRSDGNLGYSIISNGKTYCVPGDTDATPELLAQKADILFLPTTSTYTMGVDEAIKAANAIKPAVLVPYHGSAVEGRKLVEGLDASIKGVILTEL
jgi:L-ascorbate metabolism protein UlaG (beta-lactamase superfamily)